MTETVLVPLSNTYPLVTFALASVLLRERVTAPQGLSIEPAVVSVLLMS